MPVRIIHCTYELQLLSIILASFYEEEAHITVPCICPLMMMLSSETLWNMIEIVCALLYLVFQIGTVLSLHCHILHDKCVGYQTHISNQVLNPL